MTTALQPEPNWLLAGVPANELAVVRASLEPIPLDPKRFFLPAGEPLTHVYFPQAGLVSLVVRMASGASAEVAAVGREGMLGVCVLLEADPPPFELVCQVPGHAVRLPTATFARLSKELPGFRTRLLRYALALLHHTSRTAACNGLHSVEQRLARWLLLARDQIGTTTFPLTHEALARTLGAGRPFITQTAAALQDAGLIHYTRGVVQILDGARLEAVACEDYRAIEAQYALLLGWPPQPP